ncbi:MAG TPA: AAA family ATPase, partial [Planctomycetes bacterium]|nr:AAA family ATPase [Planctomycetota bacterium]
MDAEYQGIRHLRDRVMVGLSERIVGQKAVVEELLTAFFAGGHILVIGVPGLAKTLLVRTLSELLDLRFSRVQFTP